MTYGMDIIRTDTDIQKNSNSENISLPTSQSIQEHMEIDEEENNDEDSDYVIKSSPKKKRMIKESRKDSKVMNKRLNINVILTPTIPQNSKENQQFPFVSPPPIRKASE